MAAESRGFSLRPCSAAIENDLEINIADHFDLIAGTSTGGIIALGLGVGMSPAEIVHFYCHEGPRIFGNCLGWRSLLHCVCRKFPKSRLQAALQKCFGQRLLADSHKRLVIPSWNLDEEDVYLFKTPHQQRLRRDYRVPIWQIALATTAAPTYFPAFRGIDHMRLIDGGVWANNPTMVAIVEAYSMLGIPLDAIRVLSLGTSDSVVMRPGCLTVGGLLQWGLAATDVILRGQSRGACAGTPPVGKRPRHSARPKGSGCPLRTRQVVRERALGEGSPRKPDPDTSVCGALPPAHCPRVQTPVQQFNEQGGYGMNAAQREQLGRLLQHAAEFLDIPDSLYEEAVRKYEEIGN